MLNRTSSASLILGIFAVLCFFVLSGRAAAQAPVPTPTVPVVPVTPQANAGADQTGLIAQELVFDARGSSVPEGKTATYEWTFDDGVASPGDIVRHNYKRRGEYSVTLTMTLDGQIYTDQTTVKIFDRSVVLITDPATSTDQVNELLRQAEREDRLLVVIEDRTAGTDFLREDELSRLLVERVEDISRADILIDWTTGDTGLNALSKFAQLVPNLSTLRIEDKAIVTVTDSFALISRIAQSTFDVLQPRYILLTNATALDAIFEATTVDQLLSRVQKTGTEFKLIGTFSERAIKDLTPLNFMSFLVNFMVNKGVPVNTIVLILMLPIIATIFAFARQIIGLRAFGIYIPTIVTVSFLALGLTYGLTVFFVVLAVGTLFRFFFRKVRISYIPRLAIVLTMISFAILGLLAVGAYTNQSTFVAVAVFPILIMVALSEQFVSAQIEQGFLSAVFLTGETLVLSVLTYLLVSYDPFQSLILAYPELIFLTIVINYFLGRWAGLRLTEYYRFREVRRLSKLP